MKKLLVEKLLVICVILFSSSPVFADMKDQLEENIRKDRQDKQDYQEQNKQRSEDEERNNTPVNPSPRVWEDK